MVFKAQKHFDHMIPIIAPYNVEAVFCGLLPNICQTVYIPPIQPAVSCYVLLLRFDCFDCP